MTNKYSKVFSMHTKALCSLIMMTVLVLYFFNWVVVAQSDKHVAASLVKYKWKIYWGFINGGPNPPTDAEILGLSQQLATSANMTKTVTPVGSQRLVIAFPSSFPEISQIMISGFNQIGGFTREPSRSFTNGLGATTNYVVYTMTNTTSGGLTFTLQ